MPFERKMLFKPSFNRIDPDPKKNYGIASMRIWFILTGEKGAVQWQFDTGWYCKSARQHALAFPAIYNDGKVLRGWDLGYHAHEPQYEGQSSLDCDILGGKCYYDGSSLNAQLLEEGFLTEGDEWVWRKLEEYYACQFEDAEWPFHDIESAYV